MKDNISKRQLADIESWIENYQSTGVELQATTGDTKYESNGVDLQATTADTKYESIGVDLQATVATTPAKPNYEHYNYILVSCFTGWGTVSVKF